MISMAVFNTVKQNFELPYIFAHLEPDKIAAIRNLMFPNKVKSQMSNPPSTQRIS